MGRPKLLFLAHLLPWPLEGGGQIKSYNTLQGLAETYDIHLISFVRRREEADNIAHLQTLCRGGMKTILLPRTKFSNAVVAVSTLLTRQSFLIKRDESTEMRRVIAKTLAEEDYFLLWVDHLQMAQFVPVDTGRTHIVLDEHNIEFRIPKRIADTSENPLARWYAQTEWPRLRRFERQAVLRSDITLAVSEEDAEGLRGLAPEKMNQIFSVPIGVDTDYFGVVPCKSGSQTLLSIGTMYWPPNVDSLLYFCAEIYPKIKAKMPDIRLNIVGAKPVAEIIALGNADKSIQVTGSVPDVRPYAEDCGVFIVPLRSGSGMRVKILNALSMGLPVVSTTLGAEGISVTPGSDILLADSPDDFADAVVMLLRNTARAAQLGEAGRKLVETKYSWPVVGKQLRSLLEKQFPFPDHAVGTGME